MRNIDRAPALALGLLLAFTACGGQRSSLPSTPKNVGAQAIARSTASVAAPQLSVPQLSGDLAFTDAGRRNANAPVNVSLTLRYNNQTDLDTFVANVSNPNSGSFGDFLTKEQFNARFAPTVAQEANVVQSLQRAGFTITQRFANRTIVDATAPSAVVERYFSTEVHTLHQGKYGERYANVRPGIVPADIAAVVSSASLSNLVVVRTLADQSAGSSVRTAPQFPYDALGRMTIPLNTPNTAPLDSTGALVNGNFASGVLSPGWINESSTRAGDVSVTTAQADKSTYSAFMGRLTRPEVRGWASIAQQVTVPTNGRLSFEVYQGSNEPNTQYAFQAGYLLDSSGNVLTTFYTTVSNARAWVHYTIDLSAFAGRTGYIYFGCYGDGYAGDYTYQYIDDVAWVGTSTPKPSPKPTTAPTAKPTTAPTAKPSPKPTTAPTAKPTTAPTAGPSPTATPVSSCNGAPVDNGPLSNSSGTLATGVAKPFDFPVQHGCNGAGYTAAVIIDDAVNTGYVAKYLAAAGVTATGKITNEAVDGGGTGDDPETDLDVQTIAGLAPGANIIVYDIGSLSDQAIEDGYNKVLTDGTAAAVNSSFGGCESSDPSFESSTNAIAEQGAALGVEFSASAGDTGSDECGINDNAKGVSAPAGDPYFTSVGGVNFTYSTAGVLQTITAGDASCSGGVGGACYGGGGVSTLVAEPSWQSGIAGTIASGRNQPDISLPFDYVAVYTGGAFGEFLGTSWSSPASVALFIEADEVHGKRLGWLNPTLYTLFSSTRYSADYTPCTSGNNIAYSCNAGEYNQAAGIGTPKGWALAKAL